MLSSPLVPVLASVSQVWSDNLLSPPILFFFLGLVAAFIRSDLRIPKAFTKTMGLYLLFTIGFKGGFKLRESGLTEASAIAIGLALAMSALVPLAIFPILRERLGQATAAAVAATYGSVSAVTFIAATQMLASREIEASGHMVAALAAMEFPALIVGVLLARLGGADAAGTEVQTASGAGAHASGAGGPRSKGVGHVLRESITNGSIVLLLGSMVVGFITTPKGKDLTAPLWNDLFYGILCFYLLDLGLIAGRRSKDLFTAGALVIGVGLVFPPVIAVVAMGFSRMLGLSFADGFLMMGMAASASYIAAPAALRTAVPQAKASIYVPMALTLTFPFNILIGLPLYWSMAQRVWGR
jgi:hypothetical protein